MHPKKIGLLKWLFVFTCFQITGGSYAATHVEQSRVKDCVDNAIEPLLEKYGIPGMAIGLTVNGKNYFYNYGVASKETRQPVTKSTLFEIGSISKTVNVTLASYAEMNGQLSLSDTVSSRVPYLRGSHFDNISLINLATHTAGDFPLQVPDEITNDDQLMDYYKNWKPAYAAGTHRNYSNPGIGLLGVVTASSMKMTYVDAIEKILFPKLGMNHSYINVPLHEMKNYAQGYNKSDAPVRVNPGMLAFEAYGVKSNTVDMLRFIDANMKLVKLDKKLQRAIINTHTGYFTAGEITQDLIWEQYPNTADLQQLVTGNSDAMIYKSVAVTKLTPPLPPQTVVFLNKTGSTGGFGGYVLFDPAKKMGIVMLANKSYPNEARVTAAYQIMTQLSNVTMLK